MPRLGLLELLAERWVKPIAQAQELDRMVGSFGCALFHLDPAGAAFRRADLDIVISQPAQKRTPRSELVAAQAIGPTHAGTAAIDELDVHLGNGADQVESGHADVQSAEVAR